MKTPVSDIAEQRLLLACVQAGLLFDGSCAEAMTFYRQSRR